MHGTGKYSISDLAELFSISRPTVYRMLLRAEMCHEPRSCCWTEARLVGPIEAGPHTTCGPVVRRCDLILLS